MGTSLAGTLEIKKYNTPGRVLSNPEKYHLQELPTPKQYDTWQQFANALETCFNSYANVNHPGYTYYPSESSSDWGNCNSFTGSALRVTGSNWEPDYYAPGWNTTINFGFNNSKYDFNDFGYDYCDYSDFEF